MIPLNNKNVTKIYFSGTQQPDNKNERSRMDTETKQDVFVSSNTQSKNSDKRDDKKLILAIIGGAIIIGGIILAVMKFKKGNGSSSDINKNIEKSKKELNEKFIQEEAKKLNEKFIDELVIKIEPKDKIIAKEALPILIEHSKKLNLSIDDYNEYLEQITPENKDFAIKEGIPLIAENVEKVNELFNDKSKNSYLLKYLNPDNKNLFKPLLEKSVGLKISNLRPFCITLKSITDKNAEFISKEILPEIEKNSDNFKWLVGDNVAKFFKLVNSKNKNEFLNDTIPILLNNSEKLMLNKGEINVDFLKVINPETKNFVFYDLLPHLLKNSKKYKIQSSEDILAYLGAINSENKNLKINEIMPLILENNDKLKLNSGSIIAPILGHITLETKDVIKTVADNSEKLNLEGFAYSNFITSITPENKNCIPLIADNAEKLGIRNFYMDKEFKELLSKGKEGILETLKENNKK